jgi:two-component system, sensor histidine kinase RegB
MQTDPKLETAPRPASRLALPWIIRLRYAMALGQITTALVVYWVLGIELPVLWIAIPPSLVAASNVWLVQRQARAETQTAEMIGWIFVFDTLCLTAVLMLTGGPNNPFSLLYLVNITLSAAILSRRQTWALGLVSTLCFGLLFLRYRPIPELEMHHRGEGANLHLIGMWIAFAVASFLVAMFSGKISELLREREDSLLQMQEALAKKDRLASLATLAAGAAHELNTPLGTIAIVATELERYASTIRHDAALAEDSRLIRQEVDRCRQILQRMSIDGAEPAGEPITEVVVADLVDSLIRLSPGQSLRAGSLDAATAVLRIPRHAVEQALLALVKNAYEASPPGAAVTLSASREGLAVRFVVRDSGAGMSSETLRHAGEPFFTSKEPGKGMGLGIFLVRTLAERMGGQFTLLSTPNVGTAAVLELPCLAADAKAAGVKAAQ